VIGKVRIVGEDGAETPSGKLLKRVLRGKYWPKSASI
jgi:hypothetical protein